jgi:outer membrane protein OmpA-like peptidoglycan-associated protein
MDKQQEALKKVNGANVERQGDQLVVRFNSAILFDTGRSKLKTRSQKDLSAFAQVLRQYPDTDLVVEGHTDNVGKRARTRSCPRRAPTPSSRSWRRRAWPRSA